MIQINFNYSGQLKEVPIIRTDTNHFYSPTIESDSRLYFQLPDSETGGAHLVLYGQPEINFLIPLGPCTVESTQIGLPDLVFQTLSIGVSGLDFVINGIPEKLIGFTSFRLLHKLINGEDIQPNIDQMKSLGIISPRIFCRCINLFDLEPARFGSIFNEALVDLTKKLNDNWLIPQYEILVDCWQMNFAQQQQFATQCADVLRPFVHLYDLVNEFDTRWQAINPTSFSKPSGGVISSRGSGGAATNPPTPSWDYASFHNRRDAKWLETIPKDSYAIYNGFDSYPGVHCPLYYDEPKGFSSNPRGDRSNNPNDAFRLGAMISLWTSGGVFHFDNGLQSNLLDDVEHQCALQFVNGVRVNQL